MAKLKAPLMSLGASGKLGDALVFFGWKGLNVVREYVIPTNPKSDKQIIQRGYLTEAVTAVHAAQALDFRPLNAIDVTAYALLGATFPTPRTWFNTIVKQWIDQRVKGIAAAIFRDGSCTETDKQLGVTMGPSESEALITEGKLWYGLSKTALVNSIACNRGELTAGKAIPGLTNGVKYFVQYRPTAPDYFVGVRSGIYHGTPHA